MAATLPTALSLGCYSRGTTWEDIYYRTPTSYYAGLHHAIARGISGHYGGNGQLTHCFEYLNSGVHIDVVIKNNSKNPQILETIDAFVAVNSEMGGGRPWK